MDEGLFSLLGTSSPSSAIVCLAGDLTIVNDSGHPYDKDIRDNSNGTF